MNQEPVLSYEAVGLALGAIVAAFLTHYTTVPEEMNVAIVNMITLIAPTVIGGLIGAGVARSKVRPIGKMSSEEVKAMEASLESDRRVSRL